MAHGSPDWVRMITVTTIVAGAPEAHTQPSVTNTERAEIDSGITNLAINGSKTWNGYASWTPTERRRIIAIDYWIGVQEGSEFEADVLLSRENTRAGALTSGNNMFGLFHIHKHADDSYEDDRMDIFPEGFVIEAGDTLYGNGYALNVGQIKAAVHLSISIYHVPH